MKKIGRYGKKTRKLPKIFVHFCSVICCRESVRVGTVDFDDFMCSHSGGLCIETVGEGILSARSHYRYRSKILGMGQARLISLNEVSAHLGSISERTR